MFNRISTTEKRSARRSFLPLTISATAAVALAGCGGSGGNSNGNSNLVNTGATIAQPGWGVNKTATVQPSKQWTFLVYMNGANDLDTDAITNIHQMESIGSTDAVNVVVQFKRGQGFDSNTQQTFDTSNGGWSGTRRYYITKDGDQNNINSVLLSTNSALDMGDWHSLQAFVQWGIQTYPAQRYCLVVWNHGSGWRAEPIGKTGTRNVLTSRKTTGRGVSFDDVSGNYILSTQLAQAIDMGSGRKWDLLAWDCSLMQMIENDYEIKDKTQYIVGSEESPPGSGYPYDTILADLNANPGMNGKAYGSDIAQKTLDFFVANPYSGQSATGSTVIVAPNHLTQSVVDSSQLTGVASAIDNLGKVLTGAQSRYAIQIAQARGASDEYGVYDLSPSDPTFQFYQSYRDPVDFVHELIDTLPGATGPLVPDGGVQSAANGVRNAINSAVVFNVAGSQHSGSHGLSLYLPTPSDYALDDKTQAGGTAFGYGTNIRYTDLAFARAVPNWQSFLVNAAQ